MYTQAKGDTMWHRRKLDAWLITEDDLRPLLLAAVGATVMLIITVWLL
jgi:hypothetical protein